MLYLEMADIKYKRKFVKYNINYFYSDLSLPFMRHNVDTTRNVIDFCEGIGNEKSFVMGTNNTLNSHLESPQHADVSALQSLIRDRLHLVFLHQLYANDRNWKEYKIAMSHYLPYLLRSFLLKREREYALRILTRNNIMTSKDAMNLLSDCLHAIFMKMSGGKNRMNHIIEINQNSDSNIKYFYKQPTSLDAVLVAEIVCLECSQLPIRYLDQINEKPQIQYLLKYAKRIMQHYQPSILKKLVSENEIEPFQILNKPKNFNADRNKKKVKKEDRFYDKILDTDEKKNSILFVAGSVAAFAFYWKFFQPLNR